MIIKNARLKDGYKDILIENGTIVDIGCFDGDFVINAKGRRVIPGMIDIHAHGFGGYDASDFMLTDICRSLALAGTTTWFPTTMTDSIENLRKITSQRLPKSGANIPGFHLEGPYISEKRKGAQNEKYIINPDIIEFESLQNVSIVTVAPEKDGMNEFIEKCRSVVSIGHTDCDYDTACRAIDGGASCLTHTFNAMPEMLHRAPGPIGAAVEKNIYAEVICDGHHVAKAAVMSLYKALTSNRMILVSDTIRPAGLPDGKYCSGGIDVYISDGIARLYDGTLAGGSLPLLKCVLKATEFGIDFYEAVKMATETPAALMKLNKGLIKPGFDADLLILNDDFSIFCTIIDGKTFR